MLFYPNIYSNFFYSLIFLGSLQFSDPKSFYPKQLLKPEIDIIELIKINTDINKIIYDYEEDKLKQFQGKNVVFTNGCFDIVHSAQLKLLNFCKAKLCRALLNSKLLNYFLLTRRN